MKKKNTVFLKKTLIEHWGRWQWEKDEKQSLVRIKYILFSSLWLREHIVLNFLTQCYRIKSM